MEIKGLESRLRGKLREKLAILLQVLECEVPAEHHKSVLPASLTQAYPWPGGKLRHYVERVSHELAEGGSVSEGMLFEVKSLILRPPKFEVPLPDRPWWLKRLHKELSMISDSPSAINNELAAAVNNLFLGLRAHHHIAFCHPTKINAGILARISLPDTRFVRKAALRISKNLASFLDCDSDD